MQEVALFVVRCLRWCLVGAAPIILLTAAQTYLLTELTPIPLFWLVPVVLYLASWGIAIPAMLLLRANTLIIHCWLMLLEALYIVAAIFVFCISDSRDFHLSLSLLGGVSFVVSLVCHVELLKDCTSTVRSFAVITSAMCGLALGQFFMRIVMPQLSNSVWCDLAVALVMASFARGQVSLRRMLSSHPMKKVDNSTRSAALDIVLPFSLAAAIQIVFWLCPRDLVSETNVFAGALAVCLLFCERPVRFGLGIGFVVVVFVTSPWDQRTPDFDEDRSYFSTHDVRGGMKDHLRSDAPAY